MTQKIIVQSRVPVSVKRKAEKTLDSFGIDIPTLIRMILHSVANDGNIPYTMTTDQVKSLGEVSTGQAMSSEDFYEFELADRIYTSHLVRSKKAHSFIKLVKESGI